MKKQTTLIFRACAYLYRFSLLALVATSSFSMLTHSAAGKDLKVAETSGKLEVSNDSVAIAFSEKDGFVEITLSAKDSGKSQALCRSFRPASAKRDKGNKLFDIINRIDGKIVQDRSPCRIRSEIWNIGQWIWSYV